jgi:uncharacterized membrane protein
MQITDLFIILVTAMTPIGELRLAIPIAILNMDMQWYFALPISIVGNLIPVLFILVTLEKITGIFTSFNNPIGRFLTWYRLRMLSTHTSKFQKYGAAALIVLVAIPLPMTGAWTGSFAAWLFHIPIRKSFSLIAVGVIIAGIIVTTISVAGIQFFSAGI